MKPSTDRCLSHEKLTSNNASDVKTFTIPRATSHIDIGVETTNAKVTFDGTDPTAGGGYLIFMAAQQPIFRPLGAGTTITFASTAATPCVMNVAYYT